MRRYGPNLLASDSVLLTKRKQNARVMSAPPVRVTIAKRDVRWTSIRARNKAAPDKWGCYVGKVLLLKDTRKSVYNNELVAPNRFQYEIPAFSTYAWERQLIERIQSDWDACRTRADSSA